MLLSINILLSDLGRLDAPLRGSFMTAVPPWWAGALFTPACRRLSGQRSSECVTDAAQHLSFSSMNI